LTTKTEETKMDRQNAREKAVDAIAHSEEWTASSMGKKGGLIGGKSTSDLKKTAVRENGKKGGRPKKLVKNGGMK
jgi:hypothetical protein